MGSRLFILPLMEMKEDYLEASYENMTDEMSNPICTFAIILRLVASIAYGH
jgi:hypothetical protein